MATDIVIRLGAVSKQFESELEKARKQTESLNDQLGDLARKSGAAFAVLTAEVGLSTRAFAGQEAASRQLTNALQNQGIYSDALVQRYRAIAEAIKEKTGIDEDAIIKAQAYAQEILGQTEITAPLTRAIVDLSEAKHLDLNASVDLVAKGINGHVRGLEALGIKVDEHLSKEEKMAKIIEQVNQKFGGTAEQANRGLGGIRGLSEAFGDLQKEIGAHFAPTVEQAIGSLKSLLKEAKESDGLIRFAAAIIAGGAAISGLVSGLALIGKAFLGLQAIATALGTTLTASFLGPVGIAAAVVVALAAALGYMATKGKEAAETVESTKTKIGDLKKHLADLEALRNSPAAAVSGEIANIDRSIDATKAKITELEATMKKLREAPAADGNKQDPEKAKLAAKEAADEKDRQARRLEALAAHNELIRLETIHASKDLIDTQRQYAVTADQIADEKHSKERALLRQRQAELREIRAEEHALDEEQRVIFEEEILERNEEFKALDDQQKALFRIQNEQILAGQIQTERTTRQLAAKQKLEEDIAERNRFLEDQRKFGIAYAAVNQVMHSEIYRGTKQAFGDLAALQASSNSTLKAIGKVAAIANIVIRTAESAMNIYAGFSTIPIIGPSLGLAAAAAAIAFGAEQIGKVNSANAGGVVPGFGPDRDSTLSFLTPGELVVPRKNFDETVQAVAASRAGALDEQGGSPYDAAILERLRSIDEKFSAPSVYHIDGDVVGSDEFIAGLIERINDQVQYRRMRLLASEVRAA